MPDRSNDNPKDPAQMSLGGLIAALPAVRAVKKANTLSRVHRRLIERIETDQDNDPRLLFNTRSFVKPGCRTEIPATTCGHGSASTAALLCSLKQARHGTAAFRTSCSSVSRGARNHGLFWRTSTPKPCDKIRR